MKAKEGKFNEARDAAAAAKTSLDESNAKFEQAQKNLMGVSKEIQDRQKQVAALRAEVTDAHNKRQLVESIVKQEDLRSKLVDLDEKRNADYESNLWKELDAASKDLLEKTDALPVAQAQVAAPEAEYKAAKTAYEDAVKNRIDSIKQRVADEEEPVKTSPSKTSYDASPSMG
jgi:chromosome segregation ATPase